MNDMGRIDPMYQFSLDAYIELFNNSIDKSLKHPKLDERINFLNDYHTFAVYQYVICSVTVNYLVSCLKALFVVFNKTETIGLLLCLTILAENNTIQCYT